VERSTGDVLQNDLVTVSHAVAREQRLNQFGIGQVEATVRHPLNPQAEKLESRWVTCRCVSRLAALWTESKSASTVFALLFARNPRAAAQGGRCVLQWAPL
jgi:hypothetical protein